MATWDFTKPAPRLEGMTTEDSQTLVDGLWEQVRHLQEQVGLNSKNSSKPPSSNMGSSSPKGKTPPNRRRGKRTCGGQPGHEGQSREMLPIEQVDKVVDCLPPEHCACGGRVWSAKKDTPRRQQLFDLPEIRPHVTEYRIFSGRCTTCGQSHEGSLPPGTPKGMMGVRLMAWVAILIGCFHLSRRKVQYLLDGWLGLQVSLGTISNTEQDVSEALAAPYDEAKAYVPTAPVVNMDETSHRRNKAKMWMWLAVTSCVTVFLIRATRGSLVAKELLGETFAGILGTDRYSSYSWFDPKRRQLCWAHLLRDFTRISERSGLSGRVGDDLIFHTRRMFRLWHQVRDGTLDRRFLIPCMKPIQHAIEQALIRGVNCDNSKTKETCKRILALREALWTFISVEGVEPTNNISERNLRDYVIWRRISFGSRSERGDRFVERILTVSASCKQQGRNVLEFVTDVLRCHLMGLPAPSLLPSPIQNQLAVAA